MSERLEKLGDSLMGEVVIGAHLTREVNPYKGEEEDCLIVVFGPESTDTEQTDVIVKISHQGFDIDYFFGHLAIFERWTRACDTLMGKCCL